MWSELENTYSNNAVTKLENDLKADKGHLLELYNDTQGQAQVRKQQNEALHEKFFVSDKIKGRASNFANQMREAKVKLKAETENQRKIMNDIKQKHTLIMKLE